MLAMVKHFLREEPAQQRSLFIVHQGMEFQPAEIKNLANQDLFRDGFERGVRHA
jgi:hypothetical protein